VPVRNLPEKHAGRWGQGLTAANMEDRHWLRSELVAEIVFVEWTSDGHLRHSRFVALREDSRRVMCGASGFDGHRVSAVLRLTQAPEGRQFPPAIAPPMVMAIV
jgi:hypothetical protein